MKKRKESRLCFPSLQIWGVFVVTPATYFYYTSFADFFHLDNDNSRQKELKKEGKTSWRGQERIQHPRGA